MVLESIVNPLTAEKHPREMVVIGFVFSTVGLFLGLWTFGRYASIASVFLASMPLIVLMVKAIQLEEEKDIKIRKEIFLLKEHTHILSFFMYTFIGLVVSYILWFTILPHDTVNQAFEYQLETIQSITGNATGTCGGLNCILENNFRVLFFCIIFSFVYGSGAILILTWNASVIGAAVGNVFRTEITSYASSSGSVLLDYFASFPVGFSYMVHGIPEVIAYFIGTLAGGIISVAVVNHHYSSDRFKAIIIDSLDLILLSFVMLVLAGLIEVYVTPNLF